MCRLRLMKGRCLLLVLLPLILLVACDDGARQRLQLEELERMNRADSLVADSPTVALCLLDSCEAKVATWPENLQMRFRLLQARAQNKAYVPFTSDSIMTIVANYYEKNGNPNERMEAHYLLGCVYRDLGEAPKALSVFHDAVDFADTTDVDCDYALLSRVHAQTATLSRKIQLPYETLEEAHKAAVMSQRAGDSIMMLDSYMLKEEAYSLLGITDSIISISKYVSRKYLQFGDTLYSLITLKPSIKGYMNKGMMDSAKKSLDDYERLLINKPNNIVSYSMKNFNVIKAQYYLQCQKYDSAYYYYQRARKVAITPEEQLNVFRGFSRYYIGIGNADSALKYTDLYVSTDDSVYRTSIRENLAQMQALYNYERNERKAEHAEHQFSELRYRVTVVASVTLVLVIMLFLYIRRKREKMEKEYQELNTKYAESLNQYVLSKKELEQLKETKESEELLINQLKHEKAVDSEIITKLTRKIERNKARIRQNEEELQKQAIAIAEFQKDRKRPEQWNLEEGLFNLPLLSHLHASIAKGKQPSDSQLNEVIELVTSMLPDFIPQIKELYPDINRVNLLFCIFTKLRFINSERAVIFNLTKQSVTNRSAFLFKKLTGKMGGSGDFEVEIQKMG